MKKILILLWFPILLASCKKSNDCLINFFISGKVTDSSGNGLTGVEIHDVDHYNFDAKKPETTDSEGKYSFFLGSYSDIGNTYIYFKKTGYKDSITPAIGKGNGACGDQQIIRDASMEAL